MHQNLWLSESGCILYGRAWKLGRGEEESGGAFRMKGKLWLSTAGVYLKRLPMIIGFCDSCFTVDEIGYRKWNFATYI